MAPPGSRQVTVSRLKTRQLSLLLHLHEHGSVVHAAEAANMTQPAASKMLAEMESLLGVPLFERHARGVEPTRYGQVLIRRARSALSEIGRAQDEIVALSSGRMGQASIGTVVNPGTNLVPQAIAMVKREFPDLLIKVEMDYSRPLVAKLLDGQLDIVIGRIMDPESAAELEFELLADEPHVALVRADHPLAQQAQVTFVDLAAFGWIMPPKASVLRSRLDRAFLEHGQSPPRNIVETASLPVIIQLLRHSDLVAALPPESVEFFLDKGQMCVLPIDLGVRMEFFGIVRRRNHQLSPGAEHVLAALRTTARALYQKTATLQAKPSSSSDGLCIPS